MPFTVIGVDGRILLGCHGCTAGADAIASAHRCPCTICTTAPVPYEIHFESISITNYIFKLYFKYFSQLLLKSSTKYRYKIHFAKVIEIQNTF